MAIRAQGITNVGMRVPRKVPRPNERQKKATANFRTRRVCFIKCLKSGADPISDRPGFAS